MVKNNRYNGQKAQTPSLSNKNSILIFIELQKHQVSWENTKETSAASEYYICFYKRFSRDRGADDVTEFHGVIQIRTSLKGRDNLWIIYFW